MIDEILVLVSVVTGIVILILTKFSEILDVIIEILEKIERLKKGIRETEGVYEKVWEIDRPLSEKMKITKKFLVPYLYDLIYKSCRVDIEIDENRNARVIFDVETLNLSENPVVGDLWKIWFEEPTRIEDLKIYARNPENGKELYVKSLFDKANFKNIFVEFEAPIRYKEEANYIFDYFAPKMFEGGLWWDQEIPRLMIMVCVRITLPPDVKPYEVQVLDWGPGGGSRELEPGPRTEKTKDRRNVIVWKKEFPKLGHIYRIEWKEKDNLSHLNIQKYSRLHFYLNN
ncbi:MAG: hypothetical protein AYK18_13505 [Theionarchaea archaeon DG-70]|nr:MAG: hypothetical protein AYK18_13505 [Theionarchaea archaeon DG-70]